MHDNNWATAPDAIDSTRAASLSEQALDTARDLKHDAVKLADDRLHQKSDDIAGMASGWLDDVKARVQDNPIASVALVAAIGYIWGATR